MGSTGAVSRPGRVAAASIGLAVLSACMQGGGVTPQSGVSKAKASAAAVAASRKASLALAAKVKANELGQIPVIMYHRVTTHPGSPDDRTPAQFRAELEQLAKEGYVPITAAEYVRGKIGIPAGKHPVVLTFDDSSPSQLTLDGMGVPKPDTAVGILLDVARRHPGFRPVGTFYVIKDMFGQFGQAERAQVLGWLRDNGFDVGNHTRDHINLLGPPKNQVEAQIVAGQQLITSLIGTVPATLALPYGNQPKKKEWALRGAADGVRYNYGGVFLAGYTPAPSPFSNEFDPVGIPRIRSKEKVGDCVQFCSAAWLDKLKKTPEELFTSDGNVQTVAFPRFKAPFVAKAFSSNTLPY